ncbi:hypothetical protein RB195_007304 [Necator americanus]|uniref:Uncharacterized protein n=1 Tax=Necator americanus TaxID=51031 RepID=A0ABR1C0G1_NECAM
MRKPHNDKSRIKTCTHGVEKKKRTEPRESQTPFVCRDTVVHGFPWIGRFLLLDFFTDVRPLTQLNTAVSWIKVTLATQQLSRPATTTPRHYPFLLNVVQHLDGF